MKAAFDPPFEQAGFFQHANVPGDCRLGDWKLAGDLADGRGAPGQTFDDAAARRIRQRSKHTVQ